ncbi:MAG TPA: hypothetical protein VFA33_15930 [Bryobacteraceae bacterium]|nr:hypothetical protein [Bryobacteraceae bacterium]
MAVLTDPLEYCAALPYRQWFYPLGFPLELAAAAPEVLQAAEASWPDSTQAFSRPPIQVRVLVSDTRADLPPAPSYQAQGHLLVIVADAHNFAVCDHTRRFAFCRLSLAAARDLHYAGYYFLEALAYHTLTQWYLTPVHAACVARAGRGVLLCGNAGAGKSTLAYACATHGWDYLSDNDSWLLREAPEPTVLASPHRIRFRQSAADLFPELRPRLPAAAFRAAKSLAVPTSKLLGVSTARRCQIACLVFLHRSPGASPALVPLPREEAFRGLTEGLPFYEDPARREQLDSLARLAALPAYILRYRDPESALRQLGTLGA